MNPYNPMYQGAQTVASGYAIYKLIGGIIIALIILCIGFFVFRDAKKYDNWGVTKATVVTPNCNSYRQSTGSGSKRRTSIKYDCNLNIKYNVGTNIIDNIVFKSSDKPYFIGQEIDVTYNPEVPKEVQVGTKEMQKMTGMGMMGCGCCILMLSIFGFIYCMNNSCATVGAVMGIADVISPGRSYSSSNFDFGY